MEYRRKEILGFISIVVSIFSLAIILTLVFHLNENNENNKNKTHLDENVSFYGGGWNDDAYLFYDDKVIGAKSIYDIKNIDSAHIEIQKWKNEILKQYKEMNKIK